MQKRTPPPAKAVSQDNRRLGIRIRELRKAKGMTMVEVAAAIGVSQPAISQWESGIAPPGRESLVELSKLWHVPVGVLMGDQEAKPAGRKGAVPALPAGIMPSDVPVQGTAVGGAAGDFRFNGEVVDYVRRPPGITHMRNVYALWVTGDSMAPWNKDGDLIYVSPARPCAPGDYVVVQMNDQGDGEPGLAMVKQLVARTPTQLKLGQFNPEKEFAVALSKVKAVHRVLTLRELLGT
jgi:phage repressor protein C with HTH and peptisase S24 domain/DNA-binding XRE family transcriptional regulator